MRWVRRSFATPSWAGWARNTRTRAIADGLGFYAIERRPFTRVRARVARVGCLSRGKHTHLLGRHVARLE